MEFGWALRRPMRLPDSPRHERGLPAALRGVGVKPEVWCAWLEGGYAKGPVTASIQYVVVACRCTETCRGAVFWVQLYTSDQSKTIRIAVPAVMGGQPD